MSHRPAPPRPDTPNTGRRARHLSRMAALPPKHGPMRLALVQGAIAGAVAGLIISVAQVVS